MSNFRSIQAPASVVMVRPHQFTPNPETAADNSFQSAAARHEARLAQVASQCAAFGAQTLLVPSDVSLEPACRALIAAAIARFGQIDALINNAGVSAQALFGEVKADDLGWYEQLMRVNLWGSVWCTHAALPYLKQSRGSIVAVSSLAGLFGVPGRTAYS
eukprot:gene46486-62177_t